MKTVKKLSAMLLVFSMLICLCSCMNVDIKAADGSDGSGGSGLSDDPFALDDPFSSGGSASSQQGGSSQPPQGGSSSGGNTQTGENSEGSTENTASVPLYMTKQEQLDYFNENLNKVKSDFPGFKRAKQTLVTDIVLSNSLANTVVGFVKDSLLSEEVETKTAVKGSSNMELMSPDGERYVSQLTLADIKDISVMAQGQNYIITVYLPDAENPDKESGSYAKIFNFITVDDVVNTYAPKVDATVARNNIKVKYSGCYAKAMFSPDGKVLAYETYVTCVMSLLDASITKVITINTDVDITLATTTRYTDFSY